MCENGKSTKGNYHVSPLETLPLEKQNFENMSEDFRVIFFPIGKRTAVKVLISFDSSCHSRTLKFLPSCWFDSDDYSG